MMAAEVGHKEIVSELLQAKAEIDVKDSEGVTILMHACSSSNGKVVATLIETALIEEAKRQKLDHAAKELKDLQKKMLKEKASNKELTELQRRAAKAKQSDAFGEAKLEARPPGEPAVGVS